MIRQPHHYDDNNNIITDNSYDYYVKTRVAVVFFFCFMRLFFLDFHKSRIYRERIFIEQRASTLCEEDLEIRIQCKSNDSRIVGRCADSWAGLQ